MEKPSRPTVNNRVGRLREPGKTLSKLIGPPRLQQFTSTACDAGQARKCPNEPRGKRGERIVHGVTTASHSGHRRSAFGTALKTCSHSEQTNVFFNF